MPEVPGTSTVQYLRTCCTNLKTIGVYSFEGCALQESVVPLRHDWFIRKLPFDGTKLQSVGVQGHSSNQEFVSTHEQHPDER